MINKTFAGHRLFLRTGNVTEISLDHDLGDNTNGTGYTVLCHIEEFGDTIYPLPFIHLHTANGSAMERMRPVAAKLNKRRKGERCSGNRSQKDMAYLFAIVSSF